MKDLQILEKKFEELIELTPIKENKSNFYEVSIIWDTNDADLITKIVEFSEEEFDNDLLLKIFLSFASGRPIEGRNNKLYPKATWNGPCFGHHLYENEDIHFKELIDHYSLNNFGEPCGHSITSVDIKFFDEDGKAFEVDLPKIQDLFETGDDLNDTLNQLIEENGYIEINDDEEIGEFDSDDEEFDD